MATWPDDRKNMVRRLWKAENTAGDIAKIVGGGLTRNAVLGFLFRDGLLGERKAKIAAASAARTVRMSIPRAPKPAPVKPFNQPPAIKAAVASSTAPLNVAPVAPEPLPPPELVVVGQAVVLLDLKPRCCKYPVGPTPAIGDMHLQLFCAATTDDVGQPYCQRHRAIAWKPSNASSKARVIKAAIGAAHRDMVSNNRKRGSHATRAVM